MKTCLDNNQEAKQEPVQETTLVTCANGMTVFANYVSALYTQNQGQIRVIDIGGAYKSSIKRITQTDHGENQRVMASHDEDRA